MAAGLQIRGDGGVVVVVVVREEVEVGLQRNGGRWKAEDEAPEKVNSVKVSETRVYRHDVKLNPVSHTSGDVDDPAVTNPMSSMRS